MANLEERDESAGRSVLPVPVGEGGGHVTRPVPTGTLDDTEFLAVCDVANLAHNGGLDHAYEMVGDRFPIAASACDRLGAVEAGQVLRELLDLVADAGPDATLDNRADQLVGLGDGDEVRLDALVARFTSALDVLDAGLDDLP